MELIANIVLIIRKAAMEMIKVVYVISVQGIWDNVCVLNIVERQNLF